jgi:UDP-N-acetylglucosamine 3-dehydrogenase
MRPGRAVSAERTPVNPPAPTRLVALTPAPRPLKVCVVGYGNMGRNHKRVLEWMGHTVMTLDPSTGSGADHHQLTQELVDATDVVCIAAPAEDLRYIATLWINRGKDVLVEKPGSDTAADLSLDRRRAEQLGRKLLVGYTERFNPAVQALADNLHRVGRVRHIGIRRLGLPPERAGDIALDLASHDLDVLDALGFDLSLERVVRTDHHVSALLIADHISPLVVPGSASVSLEASHLHPSKVRDLEVVGDNGVLQLDYQAQTLGLLRAGRLRTALPVAQAEPLVREWEAFFNGQGSTGIAALTIAEQMTAASAVAA